MHCASTRAAGPGTELRRGSRLAAVRAYCLVLTGDPGAAAAGHRSAARTATSLPERRYLEARAARLSEAAGP